MFNRYAVYFTPPPGDFARRGSAWLGWNVQTGQAAPQPELPGLDLATITRTPRKYGFHGTMKAPFFLADGQTENALGAALHKFCRAQDPFCLEGLALSQIGPFLALTPIGDSAQLDRLAGDVVRALDDFRAPMGAAEYDRKNKPSLSGTQRQYLSDFGYPHVMEHFRFHMTLTGPLKGDEAAGLRPVVTRHFNDSIPAPLQISSLTLCGERNDGHFQEIARYPLGEAADRL